MLERPFERSVLERSKDDMIYADCMLALGILLSVSSQLRAESIPVGPGEALLGLWLLWMIFRELSPIGARVTAPLAVILAFWCAFWLSQSIGSLNAFGMREELDMRLLVHDVLAFALVCLTSCLALADRDPAGRLRGGAWLVVTLGATLLLVQIGMAFLPFSTGEINPWYWDRFRGWSENPNQLSLLCSVIVLTGFYLVEISERFADKALAFLSIAVAACAGLMTQSNSFRLAIAVGLIVIAAIKAGAWLAPRSSALRARSIVAWILAAALPILLATLLLGAGNVGLDLKSTATGLSRSSDATSDEAAHRLDLWALAWDRSLEAGLLGMGPGPHVPAPAHFVDYTKRLTEDSFERLNSMPIPGIAANFESHNTYLELLLQGGFVLVLAYGGLLTVAVASGIRSGCASLAAIVAGIAVYGIFHVMLRNPIVWFAFALVLASLASARPARPTRNGFAASAAHGPARADDHTSSLPVRALVP